MDGQQLANYLIHTLNQRAPSCTAALYWSKSPHDSDYDEFIGTGTLIRHGNASFVLTCEHVATEFFRDGAGVIVFGESPNIVQITKRDVAIREWNEEDDIALIEVHRTPSLLCPRDLADFARIEDFRNWPVSEHGYALVGFPASSVEVNSLNGRESRLFNALAYGTVEHPSRQATEHDLFLNYCLDGSLALPHPRGMSGAAVFALPRAKASEVWPGPRIVALQSAAIHGDYLRAKTIRKLFEWLD